MNKLQIEIPDEAFLFSIDIDSLYTNIDIQEGINSDEFSKNIQTKKETGQRINTIVRNQPYKEMISNSTGISIYR